MKLEPEQGITPDCWVILEIQDPTHLGYPPHQKILSGWTGNYLYSDSWRMSSLIKKLSIKVNQDFFTVETVSGSSYVLWKNREGLQISNADVYSELKERFGDSIEIVKLGLNKNG